MANTPPPPAAARCPDDLIVKILKELDPQTLAVSKSVSKSWKGLISGLPSRQVPFELFVIDDSEFCIYSLNDSVISFVHMLKFNNELESESCRYSNGVIVIKRDPHEFKVLNPNTSRFMFLPPCECDFLEICGDEDGFKFLSWDRVDDVYVNFMILSFADPQWRGLQISPPEGAVIKESDLSFGNKIVWLGTEQGSLVVFDSQTEVFSTVTLPPRLYPNPSHIAFSCGKKLCVAELQEGNLNGIIFSIYDDESQSWLNMVPYPITCPIPNGWGLGGVVSIDWTNGQIFITATTQKFEAQHVFLLDTISGHQLTHLALDMGHTGYKLCVLRRSEYNIIGGI